MVFWAEVVRLWIVDGPKLPLVFIALWLIGAVLSFLFDAYGWWFLAYEAVLAAALIIVERYKSAM